ncbi:MAG: hypothetical protein ACP5SD_10390 [Elusimicrobiales bacterium]
MKNNRKYKLDLSGNKTLSPEEYIKFLNEFAKFLGKGKRKNEKIKGKFVL